MRETWVCAIKYVNYYSWPCLTYTNAAKTFLYLDKIVIVHLVQYRQVVRSTKLKLDNSQRTPLPVEPPSEPSKELHIHIEHIRKPYTDDTG